MPIYDFICESCGKEFEETIPMSQDVMPECPECKSPKTHKVPATKTFILLGNGWSKDSYSK